MQVSSFDEYELGKAIVSKRLNDVVDVRYNFVWFDLDVQKKIERSLEKHGMKENENYLEEKIRKMRGNSMSIMHAKEKEKEEISRREGNFSQFLVKSGEQTRRKSSAPFRVL